MARSVELVQGTLEFLILKTLSRDAPMHGFEILEWIYTATDGALNIEEGSLYPALHRMERRGLLDARWGVSERGRRAKYYRLAAKGRKELSRLSAGWQRYVDVVDQLTRAAAR